MWAARVLDRCDSPKTVGSPGYAFLYLSDRGNVINAAAGGGLIMKSSRGTKVITSKRREGGQKPADRKDQIYLIVRHRFPSIDHMDPFEEDDRGVLQATADHELEWYDLSTAEKIAAVEKLSSAGWPDGKLDQLLACLVLAKELEQLDQVSLNARYDEVATEVETQGRERAGLEAQHGLLGQVKASADYEHWCSLAYWTTDEAVALAFGNNPEIINNASVNKLPEASPFRAAYNRLSLLVSRDVDGGELSDKQITPSRFRDLLKQKGVLVPAAFEAIQLAGSTAVPQDVNGKKKTSYQRIIYALAFGDRKDRPSDGEIAQKVARIKKYLELLGDPIDDETVREPLRDAVATMVSRKKVE